MSLKDLYNKRYFEISAYFQRDAKRINKLYELVSALGPESVLDVGCGQGLLVRKLNDYGIYAVGVDFSEYAVRHGVTDALFLAEAQHLPFGENAFDLVISTDFFEHIKEEDLDQVYGEMKRVGRRVAAHIATEDINPKVNKYHVTVKSKEWWAERLPGIILF